MQDTLKPLKSQLLEPVMYQNMLWYSLALNIIFTFLVTFFHEPETHNGS